MIVKKTAKVSAYGNPNAKVLWIVLHGYGQLSNYFIRKFHSLNEEKNYVLAPEGLHRFYLRGSGGRVGASWMTREERETDIHDYVDYLNQLKEEYSFHQYDKIVLIGFSQGAATSARWMELGKFFPDVYVHWAGVFPPDLVFDPDSNAFAKSENYYVVGDDDEYFDKAKIQSEVQFFEEKKISIKYLSFKGKHDIDASILMEIEGNIGVIS